MSYFEYKAEDDLSVFYFGEDVLRFGHGLIFWKAKDGSFEMCGYCRAPHCLEGLLINKRYKKEKHVEELAVA